MAVMRVQRGAVLRQVAKYTWRRVNAGHYIIGSPDSGSNWLIGSSLSASSPRCARASLSRLKALARDGNAISSLLMGATSECNLQLQVLGKSAVVASSTAQPTCWTQTCSKMTNPVGC